MKMKKLFLGAMALLANLKLCFTTLFIVIYDRLTLIIPVFNIEFNKKWGIPHFRFKNIFENSLKLAK